MDVLLVAAKKDMINDYTSVVSEAGLAPVVVDVDAFAVQNAFEVNYEAPRSETVVLVNAGASVCNINVLANGLTTFTRDVTIGGNQFTEEIQKQLNVSYDEAEKLKVGGDAAQDSDSVVPQEVERVIQPTRWPARSSAPSTSTRRPPRTRTSPACTCRAAPPRSPRSSR
jgi:type IV pilus assembly protein PilM